MTRRTIETAPSRPARRRVTWPVFVLAALAAGNAAAQEADPAIEEARAHFQRGLALFQEEDYAGALEEFRASYEIRPHPRLLYNIGLCYYALGQWVDARWEFGRQLAESDPSQVTPERRQEIEGFLAELDRQVGLIDVQVTTPGAAIAIDGTQAATSPSPVPLAVAPGEHEVRVTLDGFEPFSERVTLAAGERRALDVVLTPVPQPVPGEPPPVAGEPGPGPQVPPGGPPSPATPRTGEGLSPAWFWTVAGTAVATAAAAGIVGGLYDAKLSDFDGAVDRCNSGDDGACDDARAMAPDGNALRDATTGLAIAAGAAGAAALVLVFLTDFGSGTAEEPAVAVGASPLPGATGAAASGVLLEATVRF
jgi:hypothetical protein